MKERELIDRHCSFRFITAICFFVMSHIMRYPSSGFTINEQKINKQKKMILGGGTHRLHRLGFVVRSFTKSVEAALILMKKTWLFVAFQ